MDQDDVEEFLAVGKALRINGLNAKEQEEKEQQQGTNDNNIQHIKEEVFQGDASDADCPKYLREAILGSSSGNNNETRQHSKTTLRRHKQIGYMELSGKTWFNTNSKHQNILCHR